MLAEQAIKEVKIIYKEAYGEDISDDSAYELGQNFLNCDAYSLQNPAPVQGIFWKIS
ncbi:MAG: hypothetical protein Q8Q06_03060 [bacterium]|nr:hypothetical protein [bacterium]